MALYESLEVNRVKVTTATEPSRGRLHLVPATGSLAEAVRLGLIILLLICWAVGAYAGIVYWAVQGSIWGVVLSAIVPGFGAASTLSLYLCLGRCS